ncbi:tyrosine-type recombinase/integrase [Polynucleobacter sphagniphilus]|uniref:tyrosine-type recombinase/integrase n=1 Tax=Polynucleobacter sphagniphilus TaxID=1743169 RepID=UPI0024059C8B|nr:integrase [Polynucleobacter sphagniphilus]MDF9787133.1 integrase [Polynucleobacter sphagniphilus]
MNNLSLLFSSSTTETEPIKLLNGVLILYKRPTSHQWQCRFKLATGAWHSASTGSDQIAEATTQAIAIYETVKVKIASDLAIKTRTFRQLATQELDAAARVVQANPNKRTHVDYIHIYTKYLIPFFGAYQINDITQELVDDYVAWRISQMGKNPKTYTQRRHAGLYKRVIERARDQGLVHKHRTIPLLEVAADRAEIRPAFNQQEVDYLLQYMRDWERFGRNQRSNHMRRLCRVYVEFLLGTGIRQGTESMPIRWKALQWHWIGEQRYLRIWVSGKTGPRYLIARDFVIVALDRLITWQKLPYVNLEAVIEAKLDKKVFAFPEGDAPYSLDSVFERLMVESGLFKDATGKNRTLYSLRHTYATFALAEGIDIHTLARQMGTSTLMIEKHYSKLTPMMAAAKLA